MEGGKKIVDQEEFKIVGYLSLHKVEIAEINLI